MRRPPTANAIPAAKTPLPTARRCAPTAPATAAIRPALARVARTLDGSPRAGAVVAPAGGLVAYTGVKLGNNQTAEFTPVASYPGLTADVRARLGEMKVAPVSAEMVADGPLPEAREIIGTVSTIPKAAAQPKAKRAELN